MEKKSIDEDSKKGIGQILKEEREKIGLTYEQVCEITKLRPNIINAIEKEAWDKLPPSVFVKGFIKCYAQVLDLDPERLIEEYNAKCSNQQDNITIKKREKKKNRKKTFIWLSIIVLFIVFVGLMVFGIKRHYVFKKRLKYPTLKNTESIYTVFINRRTNFPVILEAKTRKRTWLKIAVGRYEKEKYILQPGEYISWQIRTGFELVAADAGCIDLWLNDMPIQFSKKEGQRLYLRLYPKKEKGANEI